MNQGFIGIETRKSKRTAFHGKLQSQVLVEEKKQIVIRSIETTESSIVALSAAQALSRTNGAAATTGEMNDSENGGDTDRVERESLEGSERSIFSTATHVARTRAITASMKFLEAAENFKNICTNFDLDLMAQRTMKEKLLNQFDPGSESALYPGRRGRQLRHVSRAGTSILTVQRVHHPHWPNRHTFRTFSRPRG